MKFAVSAVLLLILSTAGTFSAFAMPAPAEITLRVDVRNLVGPEGTGKLDDQVMVSLIEKASMFWRPCGVRFMARSTGNVDAVANQVPYRPKNQDDLGKILAAMDPNKDHTGIPVMIAGPWDYKDASYGLYLWGPYDASL